MDGISREVGDSGQEQIYLHCIKSVSCECNKASLNVMLFALSFDDS